VCDTVRKIKRGRGGDAFCVRFFSACNALWTENVVGGDKEKKGVKANIIRAK
jgi:hypothetical protein